MLARDTGVSRPPEPMGPPSYRLSAFLDGLSWLSLAPGGSDDYDTSGLEPHRTTSAPAPPPGNVGTSTSSAAPLSTGLTTEDNVNMRTGPGTSFPVVAQIPGDTRLQVLAQQSGWYHITTAWDTDGWIMGDYFRIQPDPTTGSANKQPRRLGSAAVAEGPLHLRSGPGAGYSSNGILNEGAVLEILALQDDWYKVRSSHGAVGWVAAGSVALDWVPDGFGAAGGAQANAPLSDVVGIAERYLGTRYVWGGAGPGGFDCSGFALYVYDRVGVWLPRTAHEQFSTDYGRVISSIGALAPGDLVFFERTTSDSGITHVGIYVGGGKMIAARNERLGVRYVGLYEPFWNSRFVGGLRPYR